MSVRRRGNGLTAESYVLLLDLDPRLADPLLAALASAGVAAYTTPTTGRSGPLLEVHPPTRPLEAVHVDSTRRPAARRVLETTMPDVTVGMPSVEEEDSFAALIAGWDAETDEHPWPDAEDLSTPTRRAVDPTDLAGGPPRRRRTDILPPPETANPETTKPDPSGTGAAEPETTTPETAAPSGGSSTNDPAPPSLRKATPPARPADGARSGADGVVDDGSEDESGDETVDDHYVPPHLPPLPPSHPVTKWGLVALGLGLILLIFPTLLGLEHTDAVDVAGVLCILGAVGLLVSRLSNRSTDEYDGPDDGAIV